MQSKNYALGSAMMVVAAVIQDSDEEFRVNLPLIKYDVEVNLKRMFYMPLLKEMFYIFYYLFMPNYLAKSKIDIHFTKFLLKILKFQNSLI